MFEELVLTDYVRARAVLASKGSIRFSVLHPVYPSVGCGRLRTLRIRPLAEGNASGFELIAGYERYERIDG